MKVNEQFLKARKAKGLTALLVIDREEGEQKRAYIRICLDVRIPFTDKKETVFVETDTKIVYDNYSSYDQGVQIPITKTCFHISVYGSTYITTFLNAITKDSEVRFKVIAYSNCTNWKKVGFVSHRLYGYINDKEYFLDQYVGPDNLASPVNTLN